MVKVRHVEQHTLGLPPLGDDVVHHPLGRFHIDVSNDHLGPKLRQAAGNRLANPPAGAGDHGHLISHKHMVH